MPVPDFQTLMRPLLEEYASGGEKPIADVRTALARSSTSPTRTSRRGLPSGWPGRSTTASAGRRRTSTACGLLGDGRGARCTRSPIAGARYSQRTPSGSTSACSRSSQSSRSSGGRGVRARRGASTPPPVDRNSDARGAHRGRLPGTARGADRRDSRPDRGDDRPPPSRTSCSTCSTRWATATGPSTRGCATGGSGDAGSTA